MAGRRKAEVYRRAVERIETPRREHLKEIVATQAPPPKLGPHGRLGIWVWIILLGTDLAYELLAFSDGTAGAPTLSQLVKRLRRAGGLTGSILLALLLAVAYVLLNLHWVTETF